MTEKVIAIKRFENGKVYLDRDDVVEVIEKIAAESLSLSTRIVLRGLAETFKEP